MKPSAIVVFALMTGLIAGTGCSSDEIPASNAATGAPGSAVSGPDDDHCVGQEMGTSDPAACTDQVGSDAGGAADEGDEPSGETGGASDCNSTHDADYGATLYNFEGDDDDCKYHASWTSTPIRLNEDVTFTINAISKAGQSPLEGLKMGDNALSRIEIYEPCSPTHIPPSQNFKMNISETSPGVYTAGPARFDQSGRWVVRFHFYEQCLDQEASPHGHIAFFVDVP